MYHVITSPPPSAPYPDLFTPAKTFESHMQALAEKGYTAITMDQLTSYWRKGVRLPEKPMVLTFDDGYHSMYKNALPVMKKLRWPGVVNLAVKNLTVAGGLEPKHVRTMLYYGWELGAHTITHPDLTTVDDARLKDELAGARKQLQEKFGVPVNAFCYPSGRHNERVIAAVKAAGYHTATTTIAGYGKPDNPYKLARVRVSGSDSASALLAKLGERS
jgi:peptidoglycan/xylan/chitin deacetylase (PgdA/CDA1 family)